MFVALRIDGANAPERESLLSSTEHGGVNMRIDGANAPEREGLLSSAEHGGVVAGANL